MSDEKADTVNIAELKARLSHYLRLVRRGRSLTILDRTTPIAKLLPHPGARARLRVRKAMRNPHDVRIPPRSDKPTDSLAILLADRNSGR